MVAEKAARTNFPYRKKPRLCGRGIRHFQSVQKMVKYRCTVCGYIYDPEQGDADGGINPGTTFEELPDDWVCPVCGADKSEFERIE